MQGSTGQHHHKEIGHNNIGTDNSTMGTTFPYALSDRWRKVSNFHWFTTTTKIKRK